MEYKNMTNDELRRIAARRVKAKKSFHSHICVYVIVNLFLITIYLLTSTGEFPWFIYLMCGWGIGLAAHYLQTKGILTNKDAPDIENEMEKLKKM